MAWNSFRNTKKLSACTAVGTADTVSLASNTLTICPLRSWSGNTNPEYFTLTDKGALRILKPGTYLLSGSAFLYSWATALGIDLAYTTTLDGTSLTRLYETRFQNGNGFDGGLSVPAKAIRFTEPADVYLRVQLRGNTGTLYPREAGTYLTAIRLNHEDEVK